MKRVRCTGHHDDDGSFVLHARLTPEQGAAVGKAFERAVEADDDVSAETSGERRTPARCNADALVAMAESFLASENGGGHGGDRHLVTVHVNAEVLAADAEGYCELDDGPSIAAEVARRLGCDASVVGIVEDGRGNPLDVGRKTRTIPPALRRTLASRDRGCRFPGCTSGHHRAVHEGGYAVEATGDLTNPWVFRRPDGTVSPRRRWARISDQVRTRR